MGNEYFPTYMLKLSDGVNYNSKLYPITPRFAIIMIDDDIMHSFCHVLHSILNIPLDFLLPTSHAFPPVMIIVILN